MTTNRFSRTFLKRFPVVLLTAGAAMASCSKELPPPGELMVVVTTDMSLPKDIDNIRVEVLSNGVTQFANDYEVGPNGLRVPATIGLVAGENPSVPARIRIIARQGGERGVARVLREAISTVPTDRLAMLRIPVSWLCDGSAKEDRPGEVTPADCPEGQTCRAGKCVKAEIPPSELESYVPEEVFGGGTGQDTGECFDTLECFKTPILARLDTANCTIPAGDDKTNVALVVDSQGDGICSGSTCLVPLDGESVEGWQTSADRTRIELPQAVCDRIRDKRVAGVAVATRCVTKKARTPTCGPWSSTGSGSTNANVVLPDASVAIPDGGGKNDGSVVLPEGGGGDLDGGPSSEGGNTVPDAGDGSSAGGKACSGDLPQTSGSAGGPKKLMFLVESSSTLANIPLSAGNMWDAVSSSLTTFVTDSRNIGIGVGLQFFPLGASPASCTADYTTPNVPVAFLPTAGSALASALAGRAPSGGRSTGPALQGALTYAQAQAIADPARQIVVVLITSGNPTECSPVDEVSLAAIAASAHSQGVGTFVIALGSSTLNLVAESGATGQSLVVTGATDTEFGASFTAALNSIITQLTGPICDVQFQGPSGVDLRTLQIFDGQNASVPKIVDASQCAAHNDVGWYLSSPDTISYCPTTCGQAQVEFFKASYQCPVASGRDGGARDASASLPNLIDDLEDGDNQIRRVGGRIGPWYAFNDATVGATQVPDPTVLFTPTDGGYLSAMCARTSGNGFTVFGAGIGFSLNDVAGRQPYSLAPYTGITFYAKGTPFRLRVLTTATVQTAQGGTCNTGCGDFYGMAISPPSNYQQYTVPFSSLVQEGTGAPVAFDPATVLGIEFMAGPNVSFDFSIDDVELYGGGQ